MVGSGCASERTPFTFHHFRSLSITLSPQQGPPSFKFSAHHAPKRISKTNLEKREAIEWIEGPGGGVPTRTLKHFQAERGWEVSGAQIRYWWKNRVAITNSPALQLRAAGDGGRPRLGEVEDVLFDQILFLRAKKEKVSPQWIQASARELAQAELDDEDFSASDKWLARFMARCGLSLRRTTNLTVLSDGELTVRAVHFLVYLASKKSALNPSSTHLMDEAAVFFEDPRRDTVDITGARHVVLRSTGFASMRITVALTITATRIKLPPLLIWKGAKQSIRKHGAVYVAHQERAWMNSELLLKWIDLTFPAVLDSCSDRGLVWDSMRAHIAKDVKTKCISKKIEMMAIPGGLTPHLQAGDIGIFKSFKDRLSSVIDEWKRSDRVQYTKGGNPRPPSVEKVVAWVSNSWKSVPDDVVQRSIATAGFADDYRDWHIAKHDVYGGLFQSRWVSVDEESSDDTDSADLADEFDELAVE